MIDHSATRSVPITAPNSLLFITTSELSHVLAGQPIGESGACKLKYAAYFELYFYNILKALIDLRLTESRHKAPKRHGGKKISLLRIHLKSRVSVVPIFAGYIAEIMNRVGILLLC